MKREIPLPAIIAAIVAIVVVLGLIGWKVLSPSGPTLDKKTVVTKKNAKDGGD